MSERLRVKHKLCNQFTVRLHTAPSMAVQPYTAGVCTGLELEDSEKEDHMAARSLKAR